jgi:hypothetical protein
MKLRSLLYALTAGVLVLLILGAGGFYWLNSQSPLNLLRGGSEANPSAAIFVPKQAPVMVSMLVNPDRLESFRQLVARPGERRRSRAEIDQLKQTLLADTNLDYRRDIQPWLGDEITWAVTTPDIDRDRQNGSQPGYLLAVTTKNAERSREFLQLFWQKQATAGSDLVFEQYKGVKLVYSNKPLEGDLRGSPLQNSLASAVVGDRFVVFANNPKVLRDAINNVQATNLNLSDSDSYKLAWQNLTQPKIGLTFVNLPAIGKWLGNDAKVEVSQKYESLAIALGLTPQGLVAETSLLTTAERQINATAPALSQPVGALQYLPENSTLVAASTNLNQLWNQISAELKSSALSQVLEQYRASLENSWGIDLPQDVFSWVQGEYALGMLPSRDRANPDWIFVAEKSPGANEASIEHLDAVAKERGFSVGTLPLGNQSITGWTKLITAPIVPGEEQSGMKLEAQVQGVHTTAGKYEIFATSVEAMDKALKAPENSMLASANFKGAIAPLPLPNDGYLYIDWASSQSILERQLLIFRVVELIGKPFFSNLRSLTVSSYGSDTLVQRSKVFFKLGAAPKT